MFIVDPLLDYFRKCRKYWIGSVIVDPLLKIGLTFASFHAFGKVPLIILLFTRYVGLGHKMSGVFSTTWGQ